MYMQKDDYKINDISISLAPYTLNEEVEYMWKRINRIGFYNKFGYNLSLPETKEIKTFISMALDNNLDDKSKQIFVDEINKVYNTDFYIKGLKVIQDSIEIIREPIEVFRKYIDKWNFKLFDSYAIKLTRFGPGGSYDSESGHIIIKTNVEKIASKTSTPEEILVHEMVHIGIEHTIIKKYNLTHEVKERIVDKFMLYHFQEILPNYSMWQKGDTRIDKYLNEDDSWDRLPNCIEKFLEETK